MRRAEDTEDTEVLPFDDRSPDATVPAIAVMGGMDALRDVADGDDFVETCPAERLTELLSPEEVPEILAGTELGSC